MPVNFNLNRSDTMNKSADLQGNANSSTNSGRQPNPKEVWITQRRSRYYNKWTLLQFIIFVLIFAASVCTLTIPKLRNENLFHLDFWMWGVLTSLVTCGELASGWGFQIIVFLIKRSFFLRRRLVYFVYTSKAALQFCIWMALFLIASEFILVPRGEKVLQNVTKIWTCLLAGTSVWLLKRLLVQFLASCFYISKYFHRIQDSLSKEHVIKTLLNSDTCTPTISMRSSAAATVADNNGGGSIPKKHDSTIGHLQRMNHKGISARDMISMMNAISTTMLHQAFLQKKQITNEGHAKIVAGEIFCGLPKSSSNKDQATREGLAMVLTNVELASLFRQANEISKPAFEDWVVNVFRERRDLALSLEDIKSLLDKVDKMLNVPVGIIILMIWFLIFGVSRVHYLIFLFPVVALFKFGDVIFTSLKFLFIQHPFDVGDRCEIMGDKMRVEEIYVLKTVFLGDDKQKIEHSNSFLSTTLIGNYRRSPDMSEAIDFCIQPSTSPKKVSKMKELILGYVKNNSEHWHPGAKIILTGAVDLHTKRVIRSLRVLHRMNFQDMVERLKRRTLLVDKMMEVFTDLKIEYSMTHMAISDGSFPALASERVPSSWRVCAN